MSEPSNIRTKSANELTEQVIRIWNNIGRTGSNARRKAAADAYRRYMENIFSTPAMERAMKKAGVKTEQDKMTFFSSFGGGSDVQVPVRQYRKNNRS